MHGVRGVVGNGPNNSGLVPMERGSRKETHQTYMDNFKRRTEEWTNEDRVLFKDPFLLHGKAFHAFRR